MSDLATSGVSGITRVGTVYLKVEYPLEKYLWAKRLKDAEQEGLVPSLLSGNNANLTRLLDEALSALYEADKILVAVSLAQVLDPQDEKPVGFVWTEPDFQVALSNLKK